MKIPYPVLVKRTEDTPKWLPVVTSVGAVLLAFIISALILAATGADPFKVFSYMYKASFGSWGALSDVIVKATPLMLIGLGCSLAFRMRLWNIGAEGQFFVGAFMAAAVVMVPLVDLETTPAWVIISLMAVLGMLGGALYAFIAGCLRQNSISTSHHHPDAQLHSSPVEQLLDFGKWSEAGFQMTKTFPKVAWLPRLADFAKQVPAFSGITLHVGILFGLISAVIVYLIIYRSNGAIRSPSSVITDAARYAGSTSPQILSSFS